MHVIGNRFLVLTFTWGFAAVTLKAGGVSSSTCDTKACLAMSEGMLSNMDLSARPCDDFYRFACGNFVDTAEIPDHKFWNSSFGQVNYKLEDQVKIILEEKSDPADPLPYRNLRHLYSLCMDEKTINARGISHAVSRMRQAGGWPVLGDWDKDGWNFLDTEIRLRNLSIGGGSLFKVFINTDSKNKSRRVLKVDQGLSSGGSSLGSLRKFLVRGMEDPIVKSYYSYMVDIAVLYGGERGTASEQLRESLLFEIEIAKLTVPMEQRRDQERMYNPFYLQDLRSEVPWVDWDKLLRSIMPEDVSLTQNELIIVLEVDFLKKLDGILQKYPNDVIANYMMWHAARNMVKSLTDDMKNRTQEFDEVLMGTTARMPRWKECVDVVKTSSSLRIALSSLYVKQFFDKTSKTEAREMVESIRQEMYMNVQEMSWMDNVTRARALQKVLQMQEHVGYPDELLDISKIEGHYEGLVLDGENYFEELLKLTQWKHNYDYHQLREPVNRTDWRYHSLIVEANGFDNAPENSMEIPAGILQQPFFDARMPKYFNYAGIGFVISHEITHGFDDQGSQYGYNGALQEWWTDDTKNIYNEKKRCFIDQYSNFVDSLTGLHLNGINTQGENVADNGGIKLAFRAYKRLNLDEPLLPGLQNYTQDQLFMLSMANIWCTRHRPQALKYQITTWVHPPAEFRVNGVLKNFPEFTKLFKCSENDAMNPGERCAVW